MIEIPPTVRWQDLLDIAIIAAVVYRVLVLFRGTRTVQIVIGVAALTGVSLLAQWLDLSGTQWILDNFWSFWAIALIVLFQPELRRALARIGQGRFLALVGVAGTERAHAADEVTRAAQALAVRRVGALIVLERTVSLRQYSELGVMLDAVLSADLLESLFQPRSPLHDGAVLVQGARVVAAACFLPLSRNVDVGRQHGSRHRAALGITEESDAIAVVVSEETGRVSLVAEGRLETPSDPDAQHTRLEELLGLSPAPARGMSFWSGVRRFRSGAHDRA